MAFSYDAVNNIVTYIYAAGDGFGDSAANPCTLAHVHAYALTQGLASKNEGSAFVFPFRLHFTSDSLTYFRMSGEHLELIPSVTSAQAFDVRCNNVIAKCSIVGSGTNALSMWFAAAIGATSVITGCYMRNFNNISFEHRCTFSNSILVDVNNPVMPRATTTSVSNITTVGGRYGIAGVSTGLLVENIRCINPTTGIRLQLSQTLRRAEIINSVTSDILTQNNSANMLYTLIDCNVQLDRIVATSINSGVLELQSTLNIRTNGGARVRLINAQDVEEYDKVLATGECSDEITYYHRATDATTDVITNREPFRLIVSLAGYETYEITNLYMTEDLGAGVRRGMLEETTVRIPLKTAIEAMVTNKGIAIKANKENYGNDRDFAIIP